MGVIMKNSVEYGVNGGVTDVMLNNSSIVGGGIASIPLVSSSTDGAVPAGATVSTQDQTTKFLREDGSWAVPSYTTSPSTSTSTLSNTVSAVLYSQVRKVINTVSLYVELNNFTSTSVTTIGTLPTGYRPNHRILSDVIVIKNTGDTFKGYAHVEIGVDGSVKVNNLGSYTDCFATIVVTFTTV